MFPVIIIFRLYGHNVLTVGKSYRSSRKLNCKGRYCRKFFTYLIINQMLEWTTEKTHFRTPNLPQSLLEPIRTWTMNILCVFVKSTRSNNRTSSGTLLGRSCVKLLSKIGFPILITMCLQIAQPQTQLGAKTPSILYDVVAFCTQ